MHKASLTAATATMGFLLTTVPAAAGPRFDEWTTIKNDRHGYAIAFPTAVFERTKPVKSEDGRIFESKDGKAKFLVGAFENSESNTLAEYRQFLLDGQYAGADVDYAPLREHWFVLSGAKDGEIFYQRVSFTCEGKLINSWAMVYPEAERKLYDRVVEAVAKTYSPGAGRTGSCD